MHSPTFPILPLPQPGTGSPQHHPVAPKAPGGRGQRTEMGIRHSWVLSLLVLLHVGFGFLSLLFSTWC